MEKGILCKQIIISDKFFKSVGQIFEFDDVIYGKEQAIAYQQKIRKSLGTLQNFYTAYAECRHLATRSRKYRNITIDSCSIIYRITDKSIEVLDIIHSASGLRKK